MKSYKPHLLKKVMGSLRKVPLGDHADAPKPLGHGGPAVTITIAHGGKPPEGSPEEEALESPDMEAMEDEAESPFGSLKSKHRFGK